MSNATAGFLIKAVAAMAVVVIASNYLVQFPVQATIGPLDLADLLTWGAFTYPIAFLVTDLTNRTLGARRARLVVACGFAVAIVAGLAMSETIQPRILIASGTAFLVAQLLDVSVFERLRNGRWWRAPLASSVIGSLVDTVLFFSLAFAASFAMLGPNDAFAIESASLLGFLPAELPRWMSWALGDLAVKLLVALAMLVPYRFLASVLPARPATESQRA